jgi:hypothetical protein
MNTIDQDLAMTTFIALHTDEEIIRLGRRAVNAKMEGLAAVLAKEIAIRDQNERQLSNLYGPRAEQTA